ncbi:toxin HicA [Paenarthrobacter nitroguajacolicus]|uniref:toxin HicA n=1 Tax=Micrococcaceae TaxID=1268 RepID=UPI001E3D8B23|nr:toxin HicA [Arthrobacter sp. AK01]MCD4850789.1 toxin HicA [Arthrobacter sp. AK01]
MGGVKKIEDKIRESAQNVSFSDLVKICEHYFGDARTTGGSHTVFKTPWQGDPRINIQDKNGKAKPYQVKQVIEAIDKFKEQGDAKS